MPSEIDYTKDEQILQVYPRLPLLSSRDAAWQGLHLGYYRQPAHETPEHAPKQYIIGIDLGWPGDLKARPERSPVITPGHGESCIYPANHPFKERWPKDAEFIDLYLDPAFLACVASEFVDLDRLEIAPQRTVYDPFLRQVGLLLKSELEQGGGASPVGSQLYVESMATTLAMHLLKHYATTKRPVQTPQEGLSPAHLRRVMAYIHEHLACDLSLVEVAGVVPLSAHYFATLFKQSTGETLLQYITRRRMERAKALLAKRTLAIADVGQQVGFRDQSYFTKVFRRYSNMTPKAYRDRL
ncbi:MAG: AraC family transcriptional regulator [Cyanobacteria bacterium P01_A01_bin.135]